MSTGGKFATTTDVPVERSRAEIEGTLERYGATHFAYATTPEGAHIAFQSNDRRVRFHVPLALKTEQRFTHRKVNQHNTAASYQPHGDPALVQKLWEQACRQRWRALALVIKAKLEAVECGITTFEEEFLAHVIMPDGLTVAEHVRPGIEQAYKDGIMPQLLPIMLTDQRKG